MRPRAGTEPREILLGLQDRFDTPLRRKRRPVRRPRELVPHASAYGVGYAAYYMIAMAPIGAFSGALTGNVQRISQERKDGWIRQLRLTSLPRTPTCWPRSSWLW